VGLLWSGQVVQGQITIKGTVYNITRAQPLEAVSVLSTSGLGTVTDSNGTYQIIVNEEDSISFSYLGRYTAKFPVRNMNFGANFDVALMVQPTELTEVRIRPRDYHMDSLANRQEYAKIFNFHKPGLSINAPGQGLGVGVDLDELINALRFQRTRRLLAFQRRLEDEEKEKFIDHRFNRSIVKKITKISDNEIDSFMIAYRPSFEFTASTTDYDFFDYIKLAYQDFRGIKTNSMKFRRPPTPTKKY
jgi:hypothetical protein